MGLGLLRGLEGPGVEEGSEGESNWRVKKGLRNLGRKSGSAAESLKLGEILGYRED